MQRGRYCSGSGIAPEIIGSFFYEVKFNSTLMYSKKYILTRDCILFATPSYYISSVFTRNNYPRIMRRQQERRFNRCFDNAMINMQH